MSRSPALGGVGLPVPEGDEIQHSERLAAAIRARIAAQGGFLPFDQFMELALYAPGLGYYAAGAHKFGAGGDFVTAPELSPLFSRCLAAQCAEVLEDLAGGDILELGAGSGVMAVGILEELQRRGRLPGCYRILEPSPELRARQQATLAAQAPHLLSRVHWLDALPQGLEGLVLANEVLDAMPVHRFRVGADRAIEEIGVRWAGGRWQEGAGPPVSPGLVAAVERLQARGLATAEGYRSEVNLRLSPWMRALSEGLRRGVVLLIDYGYPETEFYLAERTGGTLMCHFRHRVHSDPYWWVGLQDITAHVDFSAVAAGAIAAGFELSGYTTQAHFLLGCGLDRLLAEIDPADTDAHLKAVQAAKRLLLPQHMGERFQVLGLHKGTPRPLCGFGLRDLRERL